MSAERLLLVNAGLQVLVSSLLGMVMLLPLQPWVPAVLKRLPPPRALLPVHLDLYMLAFMQALAALAVWRLGAPAGVGLAAVLLVLGGWLNPLPYLFRLFKVNAFVLGGGPVQVLASLLALASALGIIVAWTILLAGWLT
jgi:hypothetical protein